MNISECVVDNGDCIGVKTRPPNENNSSTAALDGRPVLQAVYCSFLDVGVGSDKNLSTSTLGLSGFRFWVQHASRLAYRPTKKSSDTAADEEREQGAADVTVEGAPVVAEDNTHGVLITANLEDR